MRTRAGNSDHMLQVGKGALVGRAGEGGVQAVAHLTFCMQAQAAVQV